VAAIATAAAVDVLRDDGDVRRPAAAQPEPAADPLTEDEWRAAAGQLRIAGVSGTLVYTDLSCELQALRLPGLEAVPAPPGPRAGCRFELSPDGERVAPGDGAWAGGHSAYAVCRGEVTQVYWPPSGRPQFIYDGCTPAWRPAPPFLLTLVRSGTVVELEEGCPGGSPCERRLIARAALLEAAQRHPNVTEHQLVQRIDVQDLLWLSATRAVALLRVHVAGVGQHDLIAVFDRGRLARAFPFFVPGLDRLEASLDRTSVASEPKVFAFRAREGPIRSSDVGRVAAVAWSPDGRWLALAADRAIVIVAPGARRVHIPVTAADLAWR
jgi:hypothetical protein